MEPAKKLHPGITALIIIVLIGIAATAVIVITSSSAEKTNETTTSSEETTPSSSNDTPSSDATGTYKDGTYSATGSYSSPGGVQSIDLTVTIENGLMTKATDGDAEEYQDDFASAYKGLVVGKDVDKVSLSRVAGSSLTSNGFNKALDQIKTDAKA